MIFSTISSFIHLFFSEKFLKHRLLGFSYLAQFVAASFLFLYDYDMFTRSILWWSLPLTGLLQSINASMTFTFLPKKQLDPGYYSDKSTMNYIFIVENIFFALILLFQWIYMNNDVKSFLQNNPSIGLVVEIVFVFLPYTLIREPFFPKTHFRDSMGNEKNTKKENTLFFKIGLKITSIFYLFAKHFIGFALNYMRFVDQVSESYKYNIHFMLICSCFATTISMFLHTLKFKGYISGPLSFGIYIVSYSLAGLSWFGLLPLFFQAWPIIIIALAGLLVNRYAGNFFHLFQILIAIAFVAYRFHMLDSIQEEMTKTLLWGEFEKFLLNSTTDIQFLKSFSSVKDSL